MQLKALMPDIYTLIPSDYASIRCREYERLLSLYMSRAVPSVHPRFVQVGGIPGAGKSTFCAGRRWTDRLFVSFDAIMENIPAYQTDIYRLGRAGSFKKWEIPARIVGYELLRRAVEARADIYFEHSGVNRPHVQLIENLKNTVIEPKCILSFAALPWPKPGLKPANNRPTGIRRRRLLPSAIIWSTPICRLMPLKRTAFTFTIRLKTAFLSAVITGREFWSTPPELFLFLFLFLSIFRLTLKPDCVILNTF